MIPLLKVTIVGVPLYFVFEEYFQVNDWVIVVLQTAVAGIAGTFIVCVLGLDSADRKMLSSLIKNKLKWK